ncbi:hypothetical protein GCM10009090_07340 [[Pseudomonas] boreopolis]|uniref:Uncharacterized protein n=1 Tax=Xanthomonas boreopolis TaxID=86183 RepID=A0A919F642_9XANT|nr:hypothetical protein GCM10009090_07340 [[Pseudomonas] boreopolis]
MHLYRVPALAGAADSVANSSPSIPGIPFMARSLPAPPGVAKCLARKGFVAARACHALWSAASACLGRGKADPSCQGPQRIPAVAPAAGMRFKGHGTFYNSRLAAAAPGGRPRSATRLE